MKLLKLLYICILIKLLSYSLKTIRLCNSFVHVPIVTKRGKAMNIEAHTPMILFLYLLPLRLLVFQFMVFLVQVKLLFRLREVGEETEVVRLGKGSFRKQVTRRASQASPGKQVLASQLNMTVRNKSTRVE
jgi:hypothetical protein